MVKHKLIDFHCHLDLYPDFESIVAECDAKGIYTLAVTTTPKAWARNHELASKTKHVRAALGLHPQLVGSHGDEIELWESLLPQSRFVGEVGLDASPRFHSTMATQQKVFKRVLQACNKEGGKILSLHSVRATSMVLDMIDEHISLNRAKIILHWFSGSKAEARRAVDLGCHFSVNSSMMSNARTAKLITELPEDRLLTETDGPFALIDGHPAHPSNSLDSLQALSNIKGEALQKIEELIYKNFVRIVSEA